MNESYGLSTVHPNDTIFTHPSQLPKWVNPPKLLGSFRFPDILWVKQQKKASPPRRASHCESQICRFLGFFLVIAITEDNHQ